MIQFAKIHEMELVLVPVPVQVQVQAAVEVQVQVRVQLSVRVQVRVPRIEAGEGAEVMRYSKQKNYPIHSQKLESRNLLHNHLQLS